MGASMSYGHISSCIYFILENVFHPYVLFSCFVSNYQYQFKCGAVLFNENVQEYLLLRWNIV